MRPVIFAQAVFGDIRGQQTTPRSDEVHLSAAIDWLYQSQDVTDCGGSAAYYSLLTGWNGPYPETSGYIVPTLYDYAEYADSSEARDRAESMSEWLLTTQLESGAFPAGTYSGSNLEPSVFNTGQILFGLVRAFEETGDEKYRRALEKAGEWLVDVQHENGYWNRFDYRDEIHSYCSRVAWALLKIAEVLDADTFRVSAISHLDWVVSVQSDTGWFEYSAFSPDETPYLHTIAYTVRGLLESGILLEEDRYVSAAKVTADQLLECQKQEGELLGVYDQSWNSESFHCITGNAQAALIWLRLYEYVGDNRYLEAASEEIEFVKTNQILQKNGPLRGAIKGSHPIWGPYLRLRYPNWAAKFFIDYLIQEPN